MFGQYRSALSTVAREHPLIGVALTRHRNKRGEPMTFRNNPSLIELYADLPTMGDCVIQAGVQTGKSELMIAYQLWRSGWRGEIATYVMPTTSIRNRFVQNRIDPLLRDVPDYRERTPRGDDETTGVDNLTSKRFGAGTLMFLSAKTPTDWVEFSTDLMVIDEYDKCDPTHLAKARDRLSSSHRPQLIRVGNPTIPGRGIADLFSQTDRRRFHLKCPHCNHWQPIDWFTSVVEQDDGGAWVPRDRKRYRQILAGIETDIRPVCGGCRDPYPRAVQGAWVAERPVSGQGRGYRKSQLVILDRPLWSFFVEWVTAQTNPEALERFYNSVLGAAYEPHGQRITQRDLDQAAIEPPGIGAPAPDGLDKEVVVAGIDVGAVLNVTISKLHTHDDDALARRGLWVGACTSFVELQDLMVRYHVDTAVIDAMPETKKAAEFRQWGMDNGVRIWLCRFNTTPRTGTEWCGLVLKEQEQEVRVNRTGLLDATMSELRSGLRTLPEDIGLVLGFSDQMRAPVRILSPRGDRYVWDEGSKADHYRLADGYERVAAEVHRAGGGTIELDLSGVFDQSTEGARQRRRRRR